MFYNQSFIVTIPYSIEININKQPKQNKMQAREMRPLRSLIGDQRLKNGRVA